MLDDKLAIGLKERLHLGGQSIDGFIRDQAVSAFAPPERARQAEDENHQEKDEAETQVSIFQRDSPLSASALCNLAELSSLCLRP